MGDYDRFANTVQAASASALLPGALHALESKEPVAFGPIRVVSKGLEIKDELTRWRDIERANVGNGHLYVETAQGKQLDYELRVIPNYTLLLAVLKEYLGDRLS